jgi:transposase
MNDDESDLHELCLLVEEMVSNGMIAAEAARIVNINYNTYKSWLHRIRYKRSIKSFNQKLTEILKKDKLAAKQFENIKTQKIENQKPQIKYTSFTLGGYNDKR